jgi:hypothetical protein
LSWKCFIQVLQIKYGFFRDSGFLHFMVTWVYFVPCGSCLKSPRTFNQRCFRSLKIVQHDIIVVYTCYVVFLVSFWSFSSWVVPVFLLEYCIITLKICCLLFKLSFEVFSVICRLHNRRPPFKIPFYLVPLFSHVRHTSFFYLETIRRFSWNGTAVSHWRFHDNSYDCGCFKTQNFTICVFKCWILLKEVLVSVDDSLYFSLPSMNRLNQT